MAEKQHMNLVFIGHVDHGKSTLVGRLLLDTGHIDPHLIDKYRKEADDPCGKRGPYIRPENDRYRLLEC